jgi:hypothetical protein
MTIELALEMARDLAEDIGRELKWAAEAKQRVMLERFDDQAQAVVLALVNVRRQIRRKPKGKPPGP